MSGLSLLIQANWAEEHPKDDSVAVTASEALRKSLKHFDFPNSDRCWVLLAFPEDEPVGLAVVTRIPKLDARLGFLYLDELNVHQAHHRQGAACRVRQAGTRTWTGRHTPARSLRQYTCKSAVRVNEVPGQRVDVLSTWGCSKGPATLEWVHEYGRYHP
ncbi:hypothetical protein IH601_03070 [Candidatus Bipolaricaulota bacterium]|nr:hypothetical protein [Candidatus Bipolaricaulota bacterium]